MLEKTEGIILRTLPLTETSLIIRWLTPEFGRVSTVAKGARRSKSVFRGKLDLFYLASFTFRRSRSSGLHTLAEVALIEPHAFLRTDLDRLHQAAYAAQLIEQTTESDTPLAEIYRIMLDFLASLATSAAHPASVLAFEFLVLDALGLRPDLETQQLTPGAKHLLQSFGGRNRTAGSQVHLPSASDLGQTSRFLRNFMLHQLGRIPRERENALAANPAKPPSLPPAPHVPPTSRVP